MFLFVCLTNIVCICSAKSLRTPSNVFVINLALCDFLMMSKTPIFIYNSFNHGYALGSAGCQVFAMVGALSGIGAAITNACIAYDRWLLQTILCVIDTMPENIWSCGDCIGLFTTGRTKEQNLCEIQLYIFRYHVIANPLEGKLTMTKAIFIVILIWSYTVPWALFPYFKVWGRFVPGKLVYISVFLFAFFSYYMWNISVIWSEISEKKGRKKLLPFVYM